MYKTSARNMQRVTLNTMMGRGGAKKGAPALTPVQSARLAEERRLARIRRVFQLEREIELAIAAGQSTAKLRAELDGVRKGIIEVDLRLARDPKPRRDPIPAVTVHRRRGLERVRANQMRPDRRSPEVIEKGLRIDLADLAKGKITLTVVAMVKTLLKTFPQSDIAEVLKAEPKLIAKIAESPLLQLAPLLDGRSGLILADILEKEMRKMYPEEAAASSGESSPATPK